MRKRDWIVIDAATSAIAQLVQGLARMRDVGAIGVVRPGSKTELAFPSIAADTPDLVAKILEATGNALAAGYPDSVA